MPKFAHEKHVVDDDPELRRDEGLTFCDELSVKLANHSDRSVAKGINFRRGGCLKNFLAIFAEVRSCFQPKQEKHLVAVWRRVASAGNVIQVIFAVEKVEMCRGRKVEMGLLVVLALRGIETAKTCKGVVEALHLHSSHFCCTTREGMFWDVLGSLSLSLGSSTLPIQTNTVINKHIQTNTDLYKQV